MKNKYFFSALFSMAVLFAGCEPQSTESFDNIKLDNTYLSISEDGGTVVLTVTATEDWAFVETDNWPDVIERDKEGNETGRTPSWLSADKMNGISGETKVTFSAEETASGRELELSIKAGLNTQFVRIRQGSLEAVTVTNKEINENAVAGATYRTTGKVTQLGNYASYGAFWVNDGTTDKDVQIYGSTKDSKEKYPDVEVGDYVEFTGVWTSYGNFDNVEITKLEKSLLKLPESQNVPSEGGNLEVKIAYKGNGVFLGDYDKTWITYESMSFKKGEPSKLEPNPADTAVFNFIIAANEKTEARSGSIGFSSHKGGSDSEVNYVFSQKPNLPKVTTTVADALGLAQEESKAMIRIEGQVMALSSRGLIVADNTGAILVYGGGSFDLKNKIGDKVFVYGVPDIYNGGLQLGDPIIENGGDVTVEKGSPKTLDASEFGAIAGSADNVTIEYVSVKGLLSVSSDKKYYNITIDGLDAETGQVSVYYPVESLNLSDKDGQSIEVLGYVTSVSGKGKFVNVVAAEVK